MAILFVDIATNKPALSSTTHQMEELAYWFTPLSLLLNRVVRFFFTLATKRVKTLYVSGIVVNSGWLMMKGTLRFPPGGWQRRWVVLKDDCIAYYYSSCDVSDISL